MSGIVLGVDIGGTTTEAVAVDAAGHIRARADVATDTRTPEHVLDGAVRAARAALASLDGAGRGLDAIGIGTPGHVDPVAGTVRLAVNLGIGERAVPLGDALATAFGAPARVENDVRAAAVGAYEVLVRDNPQLRHLAYLGVGTGIAAGVVLDGRLHRGAEGMAGEIGHVVVDPDGPACPCGLSGCLERVAAGPALGQAWQTDDARGAAGTLYAAAHAGDADAVRIVGRVTAHLVNAVQWLVIAYGVERIVLGGGVASVGEPFLQPLRAALEAMAGRSPLAALLVPPEKLVALPVGHPTGALGAAALARHHVLDLPFMEEERKGGKA